MLGAANMEQFFGAILFIVLSFTGYVIRDGWPSWKDNLTKWGAPPWVIRLSTQIARFSGAIPCGIGAYIFTQNLLFSLAFFVSTWGGYYLDQKHGEGQSATGPMDAIYLGISGVSSMCLYGILYFAWWDNPWLVLV